MGGNELEKRFKIQNSLVTNFFYYNISRFSISGHGLWQSNVTGGTPKEYFNTDISKHKGTITSRFIFLPFVKSRVFVFSSLKQLKD